MQFSMIVLVHFVIVSFIYTSSSHSNESLRVSNAKEFLGEHVNEFISIVPNFDALDSVDSILGQCRDILAQLDDGEILLSLSIYCLCNYALDGEDLELILSSSMEKYGLNFDLNYTDPGKDCPSFLKLLRHCSFFSENLSRNFVEKLNECHLYDVADFINLENRRLTKGQDIIYLAEWLAKKNIYPEFSLKHTIQQNIGIFKDIFEEDDEILIGHLLLEMFDLVQKSFDMEIFSLSKKSDFIQEFVNLEHNPYEWTDFDRKYHSSTIERPYWIIKNTPYRSKFIKLIDRRFHRVFMNLFEKIVQFRFADESEYSMRTFRQQIGYLFKSKDSLCNINPSNYFAALITAFPHHPINWYIEEYKVYSDKFEITLKHYEFCFDFLEKFQNLIQFKQLPSIQGLIEKQIGNGFSAVGFVNALNALNCDIPTVQFQEYKSFITDENDLYFLNCVSRFLLAANAEILDPHSVFIISIFLKESKNGIPAYMFLKAVVDGQMKLSDHSSWVTESLDSEYISSHSPGNNTLENVGYLFEGSKHLYLRNKIDNLDSRIHTQTLRFTE